PEFGTLKVRKSDKSDLRWSSPRVTTAPKLIAYHPAASEGIDCSRLTRADKRPRLPWLRVNGSVHRIGSCSIGLSVPRLNAFLERSAENGCSRARACRSEPSSRISKAARASTIFWLG